MAEGGGTNRDVVISYRGENSDLTAKTAEVKEGLFTLGETAKETGSKAATLATETSNTAAGMRFLRESVEDAWSALSKLQQGGSGGAAALEEYTRAVNEAASAEQYLASSGAPLPEEFIKLKAQLEVIGQEFRQHTENLRSFAAAGAAAAAGFEKLPPIIKPIPGLADQMARAFRDAGVAANALAQSDSVVGIARNITLLTDRLTILKQQFAASGLAGTEMGNQVQRAIQVMEQELERGQASNARLTATMRETKVQAQLTGDGFRQMALSGGSLRTMLATLDSTSGGTTQAFTRMGLGIVGVYEAFKVGYREGTELRKVLVELGVTLPDLSDKIAGLVVKTHEIGDAQKKWAIEVNPTMHAASMLNQEIINLDGSLSKSIPGWGAASKAAREYEGASSDLAKLLNDSLKKGLTDYNEVVRAHSAEIVKFVEGALKSEITTWDKLPPAVQRAYAASKQMEEQKKQETEAYKKHQAELDRHITAIDRDTQAVVTAATTQTVAVYAWQEAQLKALNNATLSEEQYAARKKAINLETEAQLAIIRAKEAEEIEKLQNKKREMLDKEKAADQEIIVSKGQVAKATEDQQKAEEDLLRTMAPIHGALQKIVNEGYHPLAEGITKVAVGEQGLMDRNKLLKASIEDMKATVDPAKVSFHDLASAIDFVKAAWDRGAIGAEIFARALRTVKEAADFAAGHEPTPSTGGGGGGGF